MSIGIIWVEYFFEERKRVFQVFRQKFMSLENLKIVLKTQTLQILFVLCYTTVYTVYLPFLRRKSIYLHDLHTYIYSMELPAAAFFQQFHVSFFWACTLTNLLTQTMYKFSSNLQG